MSSFCPTSEAPIICQQVPVSRERSYGFVRWWLCFTWLTWHISEKIQHRLLSGFKLLVVVLLNSDSIIEQETCRKCLEQAVICEV